MSQCYLSTRANTDALQQFASHRSNFFAICNLLNRHKHIEMQETVMKPTYTYVSLFISEPLLSSDIKAGGVAPCVVCWCSCQPASLAGVSTAPPKVNPLIICFTAAPITDQTRGVVSGKPIIIWHESESTEVPARAHPLLLAKRKKKKAPCPPDSQRVFAATYQLPSDSFTCNVQSCVGFKGNLTYIQTGKWIKCCRFPLALVLPPSFSVSEA